MPNIPTWLLVTIAGVFLVLYLMRRRGRMGKED